MVAWSVSIALLSTINTTSADVKLAYKDVNPFTPERTTIIQIHDNKVRMEENQNPTYSLFDSQKKTLHTINTQTKQYFTTSSDSLQKRAKQMQQARAELKRNIEEQIEQLPKDQQEDARKRLEQAEKLTKIKLPHLQTNTTQRKEVIGGLECVVTELKLKEQVVREVCNAEEALHEQDFQSLLAMFNFMDKMASEFAKAQGTPEPTQGSASMHKNGLALKVEAVPSGAKSELIYISQQALDGNLFEIPSDYQEHSLVMLP